MGRLLDMSMLLLSRLTRSRLDISEQELWLELSGSFMTAWYFRILSALGELVHVSFKSRVIPEHTTSMSKQSVDLDVC